MPAPSSRTSIITLLPSWYASRKMLPTSGLPSAILSSFDSKPWSAALRIKCCNGSPISSITVRSNSVSSPVIWSSIFLSSFLLRSRTIRGKRFKTLSIGTIRTFITDSCRFVVTLSKYSICSLNPLSFLCSFVALLETNPFFAMINSLTRFIKTSSFSISTRTVRPIAGFALEVAFFSGFFCVAAAACAFGLSSVFFAGFDSFSAVCTDSSCAASSAPSNCTLNVPTTASLISDTFSIAAFTFSADSFVKYTKLKS